MIWLTVVLPSIGGVQDTQVSKVVEQSPATSFATTFNSGIFSISEQFANLKAAISSFSLSPEYYTATTTIPK